jgi:hypothetical protein
MLKSMAGIAQTKLVPPKDGYWLAKPKPPRWSIDRYPAACLILYLSYWIFSEIGLAAESPLIKHVSRGALLALVFAVVASKITRFIARRKTAFDESLMDDENRDQYAAEISVVVEGKPLGADRGVLWFSDGVMGFSGSSMAFVLAASDLLPNWISPTGKRRDKRLSKLALGLLGAPKGAYLDVVPLVRHGDSFEKRYEEFDRTREMPQEERQWPPLERYAPLVDPTPAPPQGEESLCRHEDAVAFEDDVDRGALGVAKLDQR